MILKAEKTKHKLTDHRVQKKKKILTTTATEGVMI